MSKLERAAYISVIKRNSRLRSRGLFVGLTPVQPTSKQRATGRSLRLSVRPYTWMAFAGNNRERRWYW